MDRRYSRLEPTVATLPHYTSPASSLIFSCWSFSWVHTQSFKKLLYQQYSSWRKRTTVRLALPVVQYSSGNLKYSTVQYSKPWVPCNAKPLSLALLHLGRFDRGLGGKYRCGRCNVDSTVYSIPCLMNLQRFLRADVMPFTTRCRRHHGMKPESSALSFWSPHATLKPKKPKKTNKFAKFRCTVCTVYSTVYRWKNRAGNRTHHNNQQNQQTPLPCSLTEITSQGTALKAARRARQLQH